MLRLLLLCFAGLLCSLPAVRGQCTNDTCAACVADSECRWTFDGCADAETCTEEYCITECITCEAASTCTDCFLADEAGCSWCEYSQSCGTDVCGDCEGCASSHETCCVLQADCGECNAVSQCQWCGTTDSCAPSDTCGEECGQDCLGGDDCCQLDASCSCDHYSFTDCGNCQEAPNSEGVECTWCSDDNCVDSCDQCAEAECADVACSFNTTTSTSTTTSAVPGDGDGDGSRDDDDDDETETIDLAVGLGVGLGIGLCILLIAGATFLGVTLTRLGKSGKLPFGRGKSDSKNWWNESL